MMARKKTEKTNPMKNIEPLNEHSDGGSSYQSMSSLHTTTRDSKGYDHSWRTINTAIVNQLGSIYYWCNADYEPLSKTYPTGIKHQRLFSIQRYMPQVQLEGSWLPFVEYLRFIALPRLIPKERVVQHIDDNLSYENKKGKWYEWLVLFEEVLQSLDEDKEWDLQYDKPSPEQIYDCLYRILSKNMKLVKPHPLTKNLRCWDGYDNISEPKRSGMGNYRLNLMLGDEEYGEGEDGYFMGYEEKEWREWDLILPTDVIPTEKIGAKSPYLGRYGLYDGWLDVIYSQLMIFHNDSHDCDISALKPNSRLDEDMNEYSGQSKQRFFTGLFSLVMTPLMFETNEYNRNEHQGVKANGQFNTEVLEYGLQTDADYSTQTPFWFLMATIHRWFPIERLIDETHFRLGYFASLREDNTLDDIFPILNGGFASALAVAEGNGVPKPFTGKWYSPQAVGEEYDKESINWSYQVEAMGGFARIDQQDSMIMGLGIWPQAYRNPNHLASYKHLLIRPQYVQDKEAPVKHPTVVLLDKQSMAKSFVFTPYRPHHNFYGFVNFSQLKSILNNRFS
jgi:hypothetical protein